VRHFCRRRHHAREPSKPIDEFHARQPCAGSQSDRGHPSAQLGQLGQDRREEIAGHVAHTQRGQICTSVGE